MKIYKTEMGQKYFCIYAVVANYVESGRKCTVRNFADEDEAKKYINFCKNVFNELYTNFRVNEELVWL